MVNLAQIVTMQRMSDAARIPQIDMLGVASRVEAIRSVSGLSRDAFSKTFGLDPSSYSKLAQSKKPLKSEHAFAIADRWGVTMDFIYRGDLSRIEPEMRAKIIAALNIGD